MRGRILGTRTQAGIAPGNGRHAAESVWPTKVIHMSRRRGSKTAPTPDPKGRCGTEAGYLAHLRRGERACGACREAHNARARERYERKRVGDNTRGRPSDVVQDQRRVSKPVARKAAAASVRKTVKAPAPATPTAPGRVELVAQEHLDRDPSLPEAPSFLRAKGRELWDNVSRDFELNPAGQALLGEACRTVDRLERMAAALSSRSTMWFELEPSMAEQELDAAPEFNVVVNGMIGEARQLQNVLRSTLKELGVTGVTAKAEDESSRVSLTDELKRRRQERLARAAEQAGGVW